MKSAVILHGCCDEAEYFSNQYPSSSNSHWIPWLQKQLLINGIFTQTPEMPEPYKPSYEKWCQVFEKFDINEKTILVAHSCGAGFLLRWLSENQACINKLILVAPWLDPKKIKAPFLTFTIDPNLEKRVVEMHVFISEDETVDGVRESVETIKAMFSKTIFHQCKDKGHFSFEEMKTDIFPELLEVVLS
ncbi:hypothetical protein GYA49_03140 [Candidatus Beckwithbacteria bacterium]|nr:hypothetical protein [Candidatus Beckwithbacteria bacterium]